MKYQVTINAEITANDDATAKEIADKFANHLDTFWGYEDNKARVTNLTEQPKMPCEAV